METIHNKVQSRAEQSRAEQREKGEFNVVVCLLPLAERSEENL